MNLPQPPTNWNIDQLTASLAEISLDLVRGDPLWRLARSGPAPRP